MIVIRSQILNSGSSVRDRYVTIFLCEERRIILVRVHLINPSDVSFGIGVITPRWLYVLAAATPAKYGDPVITDETLEQLDLETIQPGDVVGIGIHTGNALRGFHVGREVRQRGAWVVYGGIHATLYPEEAQNQGAGHAVVKGDGDLVWGKVIADCIAGQPLPVYDGGASMRPVLCPRGGTCFRPSNTCGHRFKPFAAALSTARSVRSGVRTGRFRGSVGPMSWCRRSSSCAGSDTGS